MTENSVPHQDPSSTGSTDETERVEVRFRVCWGTTSDRAAGAVLIVSPTDDKAHPGTPTAVDEDGDLDLELEPGEWSCTAMHPDGRQLKPRQVKVPDDVPGPGEKIELRLISLTRDISQTWGRWTFVILIALLTGLIWSWISTHRRYPNPPVPTRASIMLDAAARLRATLDETDDSGAGEALAELVANLDLLRADDSLSENFRQTLNGYEQKFRAWLADDAEIGDDALKELRLEEVAGLESTLPGLAAAELAASGRAESSLLWSRPPKLYLEILFWAAAGILVQLIITIAGYLRWNTFIKNGIYLHVALLITVPMLTLVFVQIISMGRLTTSDSTVVLDLSDPRIVAGAAFLIALVPWGLWDRIRGASRKILGDAGDAGHSSSGA